MIKLHSILIAIAILVSSCSNNDTQKAGNPSKDSSASITKKEKSPVINGAYTMEGDSVTILPFEIDLSLSPKAAAKINHDKETIIVSVYFNGTPKKNSNAVLQEDGSFFVASAEKEITYGQPVIFDAIKFSKEIYEQLEDKDVDMTVNVYSGRKSSQYNLLDCELLSDKISSIVNKKFTIKGKLIYGDD